MIAAPHLFNVEKAACPKAISRIASALIATTTSHIVWKLHASQSLSLILVPRADSSSLATLHASSCKAQYRNAKLVHLGHYALVSATVADSAEHVAIQLQHELGVRRLFAIGGTGVRRPKCDNGLGKRSGGNSRGVVGWHKTSLTVVGGTPTVAGRGVAASRSPEGHAA